MSNNMGCVLIVDDQPDNLTILSAIIKKLDYAAHTANNGQEAFEQLASIKPDLILLDIMMPGMDGFEVCEKLKADPKTHDIPVIFVSGLQDTENRLRGFKVGGVDYIPKPFKPVEVMARVKAHVELNKQRQSIQQLHQDAEKRVEELHAEIERRKQTEQMLYMFSERQTIINRIIEAANTPIETTEILYNISIELSLYFKDALIFVGLVDDQTITCCSYITDDVEPITIRLDDDVLYQELKKIRIHTIRNNLQDDPEGSFTYQIAAKYHAKTLIAVPLINHGTLLGYICLAYTTDHVFKDWDSLLLEETSIATCQSLANSLLHRQLEQQNAQLGQIVDQRTAQLNHMNQRMSAVLASVRDAIILIDEYGKISITNVGFNTLFGYEHDELFNQPIETIISTESAEAFQQALEETSTTQQPTSLELAALRKDGTPLDIDTSLAYIGDEEQFIVCSCHDITELKEAERIKDNFISMVTHELRTPISSIVLIANALKNYSDRMDDATHDRKVNQLHTQSQVMAELVESVLDISRLEARRQPHSDTPIDMQFIVNNVVDELQGTFDKKDQQLNTFIDNIPSKIHGDAVDFSRIWRNLMTNASKYTDEQGIIDVRLGYVVDSLPSKAIQYTKATLPNQGAYAVGIVSDNGHGISDEDLAELFTRFHRGWAKQSNIPGTGLGLALVKELLDVYDGKITAHSTLGEGTTFTFWIPLQPETRSISQ